MVRYSIYSGDPDGYFSIDPVSGNIRIANPLDHETKQQVLLNVQATSGDPPAYGHTQVINYILMYGSLLSLPRVVSKQTFYMPFKPNKTTATEQMPSSGPFYAQSTK